MEIDGTPHEISEILPFRQFLIKMEEIRKKLCEGRDNVRYLPRKCEEINILEFLLNP